MVRYLHYWEFLRIPRNSRKTWNSVCKGVNNTAKAKPQLGLFSVSQILHTGYKSYPAEKNFFIAQAFWKTFIVQSCSMTSESLICSIHRPALFFVLEFTDSYNQKAFVVKFTHLEQTLFVHSHHLFYSLKRCLELFLWLKERNITLWNATWFENLQIDFHLDGKKKVEIMDLLASVVLSHFHICFNVTFCP